MPGNLVVHRLMELPADERRRELFAAATGRRSYGDVREGMLGYAGWLSGAQGVRPGDCVAICLPKSLETVQLVYGILAAGAAYVPLQYQGPPARLGLILASIRPALLVTTKQMAAQLCSTEEAGQRVIAVENGDDALAQLTRGVPMLRAAAEPAATSLSVVFYSSGSTGEPKGVMWSQRTMASTLTNLPRWWQGSPSDRLISLSGLHYAASFEIFYPVISSASVYLCADRETLADQLATIIEQERTTIWASTATALRMLVEHGDLPNRDLSSLRRVAVFGEPMSIAALRAAMEALPAAEFRNVYSSTEAFDMVDYVIPRPLGAEVRRLPLGRPTPAYRLSLRNEAGDEVGAGETGEITVIGPAVAIGYWGDPALSAAKRLAGVPDSYRTGDLARFGDDGLLSLVGRKDHQVKLRGHRFDLGEIEAVARSVPGVREAVAFNPGAGTEDGEITLAVLAEGPAEAWADAERAIRLVCRERLPSFAWPSRIAMRGEFPLLSSGKIDRRALREIVAAS
jgi:amino acid adenylation domain-containing protein